MYALFSQHIYASTHKHLCTFSVQPDLTPTEASKSSASQSGTRPIHKKQGSGESDRKDVSSNSEYPATAHTPNTVTERSHVLLLESTVKNEGLVKGRKYFRHFGGFEILIAPSRGVEKIGPVYVLYLKERSMGVYKSLSLCSRL